jgi:hypothetical protein
VRYKTQNDAAPLMRFCFGFFVANLLNLAGLGPDVASAPGVVTLAGYVGGIFHRGALRAAIFVVCSNLAIARRMRALLRAGEIRVHLAAPSKGVGLVWITHRERKQTYALFCKSSRTTP